MGLMVFNRRSSVPAIDGGTQYMAADKTLTFENPTYIVLGATTFATPGIYTLFDLSSSNGAYVGDVSYLSITSEAGLSAGTPYYDAGTFSIKVRLS